MSTAATGAPYRLEEGPVQVADGPEDPVPGHYEARFRAPDGEAVRRYLTDKDRAWMLRRIDEGEHGFTEDELRSFTAPPDLAALVARMEHQSGDGA